MKSRFICYYCLMANHKIYPLEANCLHCWSAFLKKKKSTMFCSRSCSAFHNADNASKKKKETMLKKYWVESYTQTQEFKDKVKGKTKNAHTPEANKKRQETLMKKYWVTHSFQLCKSKPNAHSPEANKKRQETLIKKYWVRYSFQLANVAKEDKIKTIKKSQETMLNRYWYKYSAQVPSIKEKIIKSLRSSLSKNKAIETNLKKYGVESVLQLKEVREKAKNAMIAKYWTANPFLAISNRKTKVSEVNKKWISLINDTSLETEFLLWNYFYDIKVWNTLIEINPTFTHNSTKNFLWGSPLDKKYHYNKAKYARDNWYDFISIFDRDDPLKVLLLINKNNKKIYARNTIVKELWYKEATDFLNDYHIQWNVNNPKQSYYLGLYSGNELVMIMSFWKPRYKKNNVEWELLRLCTKRGLSILWWAEKLFKYFVKNKNPLSILSYCDKSKFSWEVYKKLWFAEKNTIPWLTWVFHGLSKDKCIELWVDYNNLPKRLSTVKDSTIRMISFNTVLWKYFWTEHDTKDNRELLERYWYLAVYDCWQTSYIWNKKVVN